VAKRIKLFDRVKPPRSVLVLGYRLKIRVVSYLEDSGADLLGAFNGETKTIFLARGCDWKPVLLHEITHAILYLSGSCEGLTQSKEESLVLALEHGLSPLL
jgi:hypothetical protein